MFTNEQYKNFGVQVSNTKDKDELRQMAEEFIFDLNDDEFITEDLEVKDEAVKDLLNNYVEFEPDTDRPISDVEVVPESTEEGLKEATNTFLSRLGSFGYRSEGQKVGINTNLERFFNERFMESITLPSNILESKAPKRKEISEDLFRPATIQSILGLVNKKERAKYEKMFEALEKKLLSEIRQRETGTDRIIIKPKDITSILSVSPELSEKDRREYYELCASALGELKKIKSSVSEYLKLLDNEEIADKEDKKRALEAMSKADFEFIKDFGKAEISLYDEFGAKGRALYLMLRIADVLDDGSEFVSGEFAASTSDDGSVRPASGWIEVVEESEDEVDEQTEKIEMDPLGFLAFNSQLKKVPVKGILGETKEKIKQYLEDISNSIEATEELSESEMNALFDAKEKVLELIETYEDNAEDFYGGQPFGPLTSEDTQIRSEVGVTSVSYPLPIFFLDIDIIRREFKVEADLMGPNDFLRAFSDLMQKGSRGGKTPAYAGKGRDKTPLTGVRSQTEGQTISPRGTSRSRSFNLGNVVSREGFIQEEIDIISKMQLAIRKSFIDLPKKSGMMPIKFPFKVQMGRALKPIKGKEVETDVDLRLDAIVEETNSSNLRKGSEKLLPFLTMIKTGRSPSGQRLIKINEILSEGKKFVRAIAQIFEYSKGESAYKDVVSEVASLIRTITKGQSSARGAEFMGVELSNIKATSRPDFIQLASLARAIESNKSQMVYRGDKAKTTHPAIKVLELLQDLNIAKSEIHEKLLNAHDELRILKGEEVFFGMLRTDNLDDILTIQKTLYEENLDVSAGEITNIVKSLDSHASISKEYGIPTESVYIIKSHFR